MSFQLTKKKFAIQESRLKAEWTALSQSGGHLATLTEKQSYKTELNAKHNEQLLFRICKEMFGLVKKRAYVKKIVKVLMFAPVIKDAKRIILLKIT